MTWEIWTIIVSLLFWIIIAWFRKYLVYTKFGEGPTGDRVTMPRFKFILWFLANFIPIVNIVVITINFINIHHFVYKEEEWNWNFGNNKFINWLNKEV